MLALTLRSLAALLTFAVGIAAAALWHSVSSDELEKTVTPVPPTVLIAMQAQAELPPPPPPPFKGVSPRHIVISGGVLNGKAVSKPQPVYPPIAMAAKAQGTVVVQILLDEEGKVLSANAVSGHPLLQQAAVAAARTAKFSPTFLSGQPVKVSGVITYNFVLE